MNRFLALLAVWLLTGTAQAQVDQRKGTDAEFGKHYTLGDETKWDVVLKSAELTLDRVVGGDDFEAVGKDLKRILFHFSVQNARDGEQNLSGDSLPLTVVDKEKQSHDARHWLFVEGKPETADMNCKPAQRCEIVAYVDLPSAAVPDKLLVLPGADEALPILRYALSGKVKPLPAKAADPADTSGATPLDLLPCTLGEWVQAGPWDVRVDGAGEHADKVPDAELEAGKRWYAVSVTLRNGTRAAQELYWSTLTAHVVLPDDSEVKATDALLAKAAKSVSLSVRPQTEVALRLVFALDKDAKPARLVFCDEQLTVRQHVCPLVDKAP